MLKSSWGRGPPREPRADGTEHQHGGDGACTEHRWEASQQSGVSSEGHVQADGATTGKTVMWEHEWSIQRMLRKPEGQERGSSRNW